MHTAGLDIQRFVDSALSKVSERRVDLVYLPKRANIILGIAYNPIYSRFLKWDSVVELGGLLFGSETTSFTDEQPEWLQAGALFTELCVEQCKRQAQKSILEHIWREGELIGPTGPHEYLGFARACFNSGLCEAGSDSAVAISKEDWLACQRNLKLCQALAKQMKSEGQKLLINPPVEDKNENELTRAMRMADRLVQENARQIQTDQLNYGSQTSKWSWQPSNMWQKLGDSLSSFLRTKRHWWTGKRRRERQGEDGEEGEGGVKEGRGL